MLVGIGLGRLHKQIQKSKAFAFNALCMEKYLYSRMCKTKSKLLCILDVKKNRGHQTRIYINQPNPPHCSIFVAHLTSGWKSLIDLRFEASTSTLSPLDYTLVHTWHQHLEVAFGRRGSLVVVLACDTCLWHLLVVLACVPKLWHLAPSPPGCGTWSRASAQLAVELVLAVAARNQAAARPPLHSPVVEQDTTYTTN